MSNTETSKNTLNSIGNGNNTSKEADLFLRVHIIDGKNLAAKDRNGLSDPFVVCKIGNKKKSTKIIKKSLDPVWDELLDLEIETDPQSIIFTYVKLTCWDRDRFKNNEFMGIIKIDLLTLFDKDTKQPILFNNQKENNFKLNKRHVKDQVSGEIRAKIGFVIANDKGRQFLTKLRIVLEKSVLFSKNNITSSISETNSNDSNSNFNNTNVSNNNEMTTPTEKTSGIIILDIISANDLPYDKNVLRKSFDMDPFVIASLGTKTYKTSFIRHTLNPVWNQRIIFTINEDDYNFSIKLSVYDHDKFSNNDYIGSAVIKVSDIVNQSHQLNNSNSNISGGNEDKFMSSSSDNSDSEKSNTSNNNNNSTLSSIDNILALPLDLQNEFWQKSFNSMLLIRTQFKSHDRIKLDFWKAMFKHYDTDNSGFINHSELAIMLDSLQSSFSDQTINRVFFKNSKEESKHALNFKELIESLDTLMPKENDKNQQNSSNSLLDIENEKIINASNCPLCNKKFSKTLDVDKISHIALCSSGDVAKVNRIIMGNFITEANAQRKWYVKIANLLSYGNYKLGKNNAHILVKDRKTGELIEEKMPTYVRLGIRLLYTSIGSKNTIESSTVRNILKNLSFKQGRKFNSPKSKKDIVPFINFHKLNTNEILEPLESFNTFNEFFYRKLKPQARKAQSPDECIAVSPADSRVMAFETINMATEMWIKGRNFTIQTLLQDSINKQDLTAYENGSLAIFRLAPQDYHRFHIPVDGIISESYKIEGQYYTVNPMAIRSSLDVYGENTRVINFIDSPKFGKVAIVCIGAMMVGSVVITVKPNTKVERTQEHGYFAFGGSTVILVFQKDKIVFDSDIVANSNQPIETLLKMGNSIGKAVN